MTPYTTLQEIFHKLDRINHAATFLVWDQLVMMPPGGSSRRAESIAELTTLHHEILTAPHLPDLIQQAKQQESDDNIHRSLLEMERCHNQAACLPADLVKQKSLAGSRCEHAWRTQRQENDFKSFLKNFKEVVNLSRQEAQARRAYDSEKFATPYDAMLDLYCTGDSSERIQSVFATLKHELPSLLQQILDNQPGNLPKPGGPFDKKQQLALSRKLMEYLGFNFNNGRLDVSLHPFSTGDKGDQRITTRFRSDDFFEALLATAHETGHASYENGLPKHWGGLPVGTARNMCIHESQSLLFEKQLFLSREFFSFFISDIQNLLPSTALLSADDLWSACCHVAPSLIRVEADEVTYPFHVILRFEIEKDLINGKIEAEDIPEIWHNKMQKYLGLPTAGNDRDGCMQDIHWTDGSFGYFPSYTMGAVNGAQLFSAFKKAHPDWPQLLSQGDTSSLRSWLEKNVWVKASSLDSQDIMNAATGSRTDAQYFISHLKARYLTQD